MAKPLRLLRMEIKRFTTIDEQFEAGKQAFMEKDFQEACKLLRLALGNIQEPTHNNDIIYWLEKAELCRKHFEAACFYQELEFYEESYEHMKELYPFVEEMSWPWHNVEGQIYILKKDISGKYGYQNKDGVWKIDPLFEKAYLFREGHARVNINGKIGFIDRKGVQVVKPIYEEADDFENGLALVKRDGQSFMINRLGVELEQVEVEING